MKEVRTRFAPSPTGFMHVGGVRTALFAWLVARQAGGKFLLRIEDTDKNREVEGSMEHIMESLRWLGLEWDEGPDKGGPYEPYKQSQRLDTYKQWGEKLISQGRAYADPYSIEELDNFRTQAQKDKKPFLYRDHRPENPPKWDGSMPLRFKSEPKAYQWHDAVLGDLSAGEEAVDDFILIKSDGYPTYNFCHIVDDELMQITHVIRSQEFIASVPRFLNLYDALGIEWPILATLPYVMAADGKRKLGKRDGAKDILDYRKAGYLPETLINFLATLGWNDGTEQEIFSVQEITEKFSLDRVQKSGAAFDEQRLLWMSGSHIRALSLDELFPLVESYWPEQAEDSPEEYKKSVLSLIQERLKYFAEIPELTSFFFTVPPVNVELINSNKYLGKIEHPRLIELLTITKEKLGGIDFAIDKLQEALNDLLEVTDEKPGTLFSLIRVATTWAPASPGLAESLNVLGKEASLGRIEIAIHSL